MRRLLIVACSRRKRTDAGLLPAFERYDGPVFRVLRRYGREQSLDSLGIYVLSAEFGLFPASRPIPHYDRSMTATRAHELQPAVVAGLRRLATHHQDVFICAGKSYLSAMEPNETLLREGLALTIASGALGKQLATLHDWLYQRPPQAWHTAGMVATKGAIRLRGVEITHTPEQALAIARRAALESAGDPNRYHAWYVPVDGQRVAPKWLVSQMTGLPVGAFVTDEARRVLAQLGIEVHRA